MKKFNPGEVRFRASFSAASTNEPRFGAADKENGVLRDVQITLEGEAKGHGVYLDREFCEQVVEAGNATGDVGVKVRFGHPAMCADALGTYLGRAKNFRMSEVTRKESGEKASGVIADVYLDKNADRYDWVMNMSESAPDSFGMSIVFTYGDYIVKDADGNRHSYREEVAEPFNAFLKDNPKATNGEKSDKYDALFGDWEAKSADGKTYVTLAKLHGSDFTDTPAATDGVFSDETLASQASTMLEENPRVREMLLNDPQRVIQFLKRNDLFDAFGAALESARVAGLQAAKDKEISALKAKIGELENQIAENAALKSANAEIDQLKSVNDETEKKLASALADVERLGGEIGTMTKELAEARDQLSAWESHASAHGANVNTPPSLGAAVGTRADAIKQLSALPPSQREAFYREHRELIDGIIK